MDHTFDAGGFRCGRRRHVDTFGIRQLCGRPIASRLRSGYKHQKELWYKWAKPNMLCSFGGANRKPAPGRRSVRPEHRFISSVHNMSKQTPSVDVTIQSGLSMRPTHMC